MIRPRIVFCPKCHKKIVVPSWLTTSNIVSASGFINLNCEDKRCDGSVKYKVGKPEPQPEMAEIKQEDNGSRNSSDLELTSQGLGNSSGSDQL